jgi:hypothetical protein
MKLIYAVFILLLALMTLAQCQQTAEGWSSPDAVVIDTCSLPSTQGWKYLAVGNSYAEDKIFSVQGCVLRQDSIGVGFGSPGSNLYQIANVVDSTKPFVLEVRAKVLNEEQSDDLNHWGFSFWIKTGTEDFAIGISPHAIVGSKVATDWGETLTTSVDNTVFHDYRLEGTPGVGYKFYVDNLLVGSGSAWAGGSGPLAENGLYLGDGTGGANAKAEITSFRFEQ